MRLTSSAGHGVRAGKLLAVIVASVLLWACSGSDNSADTSANATPATPSQPTPDQPTPSVKANTVSAAIEEGGNVVAYVGNSASITLAFSTAEGAATALKLEPPAAPGWQSADGKLGCDSVSANQPCKLKLLYAPDAPAASATLKLGYGYVDSAGNARSDSLSVNYRALAANAATATLDPAGTVNAVVGVNSTVTLSFGTNDGSAAGALHVDLAAALPAGWSGSAPVFDCPSFGGSACQLQLVYQPTAATAQSSFDLPYSYVDSAGKAQAAKLAITYAAVAPNTVFANVLPASQVVAAPGASREVTFSFLPSDGKLASAVKLAAGATLPEGWSIKSSNLPCRTVNADGTCQLVLSFAPTSSLPLQQLDLGFEYVNAVGQAQHGVASVFYSSRIYSAYVADYDDGSLGGGGVRQCEVAADGTLLNCAKVTSAWPAIATNRVIVSGSRAYVTTNLPTISGTRAISACDLNIDGGLINCANAGASYDKISSFAVLGQDGYLISPITSSVNTGNRITRCTLDGRGELPQDNCALLPTEITGGVLPTALTAFKSSLYVAAAVDGTNTGARLLRCAANPNDATQILCDTIAAEYPQSVQGMAVASLAGRDYLYLLSASNSSGAIVKCNLAADGGITGCDGGKLPVNLASTDLAQPGNIAIVGKLAYIAVGGGKLKGIQRCQIDEATGDLGTCVDAGDTGSNMPVDIAIR